MPVARKTFCSLILILIFAIILSLIPSAGAFSLFIRKEKEKEIDGIAVPIIMYHEVKPYKTGKDVITPSEIESDLQFLKQNGYTTVTMTDLIDYTLGRKQLPAKPIVLSFDDGYLNNYIYVFPLLKKYDIKIVFSVIGKNTDDFTRIPDDNLDYSHVTWAQLEEMQKSGFVEIQNHTYDMHTVGRGRYGCRINKGESAAHYEQALIKDIDHLQQQIRAVTGTTPNTFVYPYGKTSRESLPVIKKMGFKASLTCDYGVNILAKDPQSLFGLKRICRSHGVPIKKALEQAMKTLRFR